jgi:hypothetical protein
MESYQEVITVADFSSADRSCEALEQAKIPVVIRHVELACNGTNSSGCLLSL